MFVYHICRASIIRALNLTLHRKVFKTINNNDKTLIDYGRFWIASPNVMQREKKKSFPLNKQNKETHTFILKIIGA